MPTAEAPPPSPPVAAAVDAVVIPQGACVVCYDESIFVTLVHANASKLVTVSNFTVSTVVRLCDCHSS